MSMTPTTSIPTTATEPKLYLGIDPGITGAIAMLWCERDVITDILCEKVRVVVSNNKKWIDERWAWDMCNTAKNYGDCDYNTLALLEKAQPMARKVIRDGKEVKLREGGVSLGVYMATFGFWRGALSASEIPYMIIPPASWKRILVGTNKSKGASIEVAQRMFPKISLKPTERCRNPDHNMAEALLLAEFARRCTNQWGNEVNPLRPVPTSRKSPKNRVAAFNG